MKSTGISRKVERKTQRWKAERTLHEKKNRKLPSSNFYINYMLEGSYLGQYRVEYSNGFQLFLVPLLNAIPEEFHLRVWPPLRGASRPSLPGVTATS